MNKSTTHLLALSAFFCFTGKASAQISKIADFKNQYSAPIGSFMGVNFREGGFSGLYAIPGTGAKEFWTLSDRGVNVDCGSANPSTCRPTYDKLFCFPNYAPKIHRVKIDGDSVQILKTITIKRPNATATVGYLLPAGFGSTAVEQASTDTVMDCANFSSKLAPKDPWSIDGESISVDRNGYFWVSEENGPSIWKLDSNGVVLKRYSPYANLMGAEPQDVLIDTCFKYRKNNRGLENLAITPNGKVYALIQSPLLYPSKSVGEASRIHRLLELDPVTGATRMFAYLNDGIIGSGVDQIRLRDWKLGDMAAINDTTFLVLEAAARGATDIKRMYQININGASVVHSGLYGGKTLEALVDSAGLAGAGLQPVRKTLVMDLLANGWDPSLDKAEGLAIINDSTLAIANDNDFGQTCPAENGIPVATTSLSHIVLYSLKGSNKLQNYVAPKSLSVANPLVSGKEVHLFPNPASAMVTLSFELEQTMPVQVSILDLQGRVLYHSGSLQLSAGMQQLELPTASLEQGLYLVRLEQVSSVSLLKLQVRH